MTRQLRNLVSHSFRGGRFEDHGVDVDAMQDLLRYKNLVVQVAKEIWRRSNPERQRLPRNFEDALSVRFYEVLPNCATIPLMREVEVEEQRKLWETTDELDDAVELVARTIQAAGEDKAIPDEFPKQLIHLFEDYGRSLETDEWIEQQPAKWDHSSRYDSVVCQRLARWVSEPYEDAIDLVGEVTMARVSRPRMAIAIDEKEVEAEFRPEDEDVITTALKDHSTAKLRITGRGQFTADGCLQRIIDVDNVSLLPSGELSIDTSAKSIWDDFEDIISQIPSENLAKLPTDAAERHDFYIYGREDEE